MQVLELLWLREAHALHPRGDDLPPPLVATPAPAAAVADDVTRAEWEGAWAGVWREVVEHAGREHDLLLFERIRATADGSPERESLLRELVGPSWSDRFDASVFQDPSYLEWERSGMDALRATNRGALEDDPERRDLEALVLAWRRGLTKIVTIPCRGEWNRRIGPNALLVTADTRADSDAYRLALTSFA